jgi:ABC-type enterochelin transport system permease subunit
MSDVTAALIIWLPLGTIVPLIVSRLTGADWRGALIEASIFATMGLIVFPILIALVVAIFTRDPNVDVIFGVSYLLAILSVLLFRRQSNKTRRMAQDLDR